MKNEVRYFYCERNDMLYKQDDGYMYCIDIKQLGEWIHSRITIDSGFLMRIPPVLLHFYLEEE